MEVIQCFRNTLLFIWLIPELFQTQMGQKNICSIFDNFMFMGLNLWLLLLSYRPPTREVFPNNEVTKPQKGTSPNLVSISYWYVYTLCPSPPSLFAAQCPSDGTTPSCPSSHAIVVRPVCPYILSSAHPDVPCLYPSILKSPRLPCRLPHGFLRSSKCCPSLSVSNFPCHPSLPDI